MKIEDLERQDSLGIIWSIFDRMQEPMEYKRLDIADMAWENARRKPGQDMDEWHTYLKETEIQVKENDPNYVITPGQFARKLLRGTGLSAESRALVLLNCGGKYDDPERLLKVLMWMYPNIGHKENKQGLVMRKNDKKFNPVRKNPFDFRARGDGNSTIARIRGTGSTTTSYTPRPRTSITRTQGYKPKGMQRDIHETENVDRDDDGDNDDSDASEETLDSEDDHYENYPVDAGEDEEDLESEEEEEVIQNVAEAIGSTLGHEAAAAVFATLKKKQWRAKDKTASARKARGWTQPSSQNTGTQQDARPKQRPHGPTPDPSRATDICKACGEMGHWSGDPTCPKTISGEVKPFRPPRSSTSSALPSRKKEVHVTTGSMTKEIGSNANLSSTASGGKEPALGHTVPVSSSPAFTVSGSKDIMPGRIIKYDPKKVQEVHRSFMVQKKERSEESSEDPSIERPSMGRRQPAENQRSPTPLRRRVEPQTWTVRKKMKYEDGRSEIQSSSLFKVVHITQDGKYPVLVMKFKTDDMVEYLKKRLGIEPITYGDSGHGGQIFKWTKSSVEPDNGKSMDLVVESNLETTWDKERCLETLARVLWPIHESNSRERKSDKQRESEEGSQPKRKLEDQRTERASSGSRGTSSVSHWKTLRSSPIRQMERSEGQHRREHEDRREGSWTNRGKRTSEVVPSAVAKSNQFNKNDEEDMTWLIRKFAPVQDMFDEIALAGHIFVIHQMEIKMMDLRLKILRRRPFSDERCEAGRKVGRAFVTTDGDWVMNEDQREDANREKVENRRELQNVKAEKEQLLQHLAEIQAKEKELIKKTEGESDSRTSPSKKYDKNEVFDTLLKRRQEEAVKKKENVKEEESTPIGPEDLMSGTSFVRERGERSKGSASSSSNTPGRISQAEAASAMMEPKTLISADGVVLEPKEEAIGKKKKESKDEALKKEMDARQRKEDGRLEPSPTVKYSKANLKEQLDCDHPYEELQWGANAVSVYASCKKCSLKSVICYKKKGTFMTKHVVENVNQQQVYLVRLQRGKAMGDTGCHAPLAGPSWHKDMQDEMKIRGWKFSGREQYEEFAFGPGEPIVSNTVWTYTVYVHGRQYELEISEVPMECPALIGKDQLKQWQLLWDFENEIMLSKDGYLEVEYTKTGHPCVDLLRVEPPKHFDKDQIEVIVVALAAAAQKAKGGDTDSLKDESRGAHVVHAVEREDGNVVDDERGLIDENEEEDNGEMFGFGSDDDISDDDPDDGRTEDRYVEYYDISSKDGSTEEESDHAWSDADESDNSEDVTDDDDDLKHIFMTEIDADTRYMSKGAKRAVRSNLQAITKANQEEKSLKQRNLEEYRNWYREEVERPLNPNLHRSRRSGPWRFLEIFTWTCAMTIQAMTMGWETYEPITLPKFDLMTVDGRQNARDYIVYADPDFVFLAQPCTPWSIMQNMNQRNPEQIRRLHEEQERHRQLLTFVEEVVHFQHQRGRAVGSESPTTAASWKEAPIEAAFHRPGMSSTITHMCQYGKIRPDNGLPIRKSTMVKGTAEVCEAVSLKCLGNHAHSPIEGSMKISVRKKNGKTTTKTMKVSEWAGGYTKEFAKALLNGALKYLERMMAQRTWEKQSYPVEDPQANQEQMPEESMMDPDDEPIGNW